MLGVVGTPGRGFFVVREPLTLPAMGWATSMHTTNTALTGHASDLDASSVCTTAYVPDFDGFSDPRHRQVLELSAFSPIRPSCFCPAWRSYLGTLDGDGAGDADHARARTNG